MNNQTLRGIRFYTDANNNAFFSAEDVATKLWQPRTKKVKDKIYSGTRIDRLIKVTKNSLIKKDSFITEGDLLTACLSTMSSYSNDFRSWVIKDLLPTIKSAPETKTTNKKSELVWVENFRRALLPSGNRKRNTPSKYAIVYHGGIPFRFGYFSDAYSETVYVSLDGIYRNIGKITSRDNKVVDACGVQIGVDFSTEEVIFYKLDIKK